MKEWFWTKVIGIIHILCLTARKTVIPVIPWLSSVRIRSKDSQSFLTVKHLLTQTQSMRPRSVLPIPSSSSCATWSAFSASWKWRHLALAVYLRLSTEFYPTQLDNHHFSEMEHFSFVSKNVRYLSAFRTGRVIARAMLNGTADILCFFVVMVVPWSCYFFGATKELMVLNIYIYIYCIYIYMRSIAKQTIRKLKRREQRLEACSVADLDWCLESDFDLPKVLLMGYVSMGHTIFGTIMVDFSSLGYAVALIHPFISSRWNWWVDVLERPRYWSRLKGLGQHRLVNENLRGEISRNDMKRCQFFVSNIWRSDKATSKIQVVEVLCSRSALIFFWNFHEFPARQKLPNKNPSEFHFWWPKTDLLCQFQWDISNKTQKKGKGKTVRRHEPKTGSLFFFWKGGGDWLSELASIFAGHYLLSDVPWNLP